MASTKNRPASADRLRQLYDEWREQETRHGRASALVNFADDLGYQSHSAIGDMLNGKRLVSSDVLVQARNKWGVSPDWLLGGDGPMYVYQVDAAGECRALDAMLAEHLKGAIAAASTTELPMDHGRSHYEAQGLRVGVDISDEKTHPAFVVDGKAALAWIEELVVAEAVALHQWRATYNALTALQTARLDLNTLAQKGGDPDYRNVDWLGSARAALNSPWARAAQYPPPPAWRVVEGK